MVHYRPWSSKENPTTFRLHKASVCLAGFGATFGVVFVLIYLLREFPLSAVTNHFEFRCLLALSLLDLSR